MLEIIEQFYAYMDFKNSIIEEDLACIEKNFHTLIYKVINDDFQASIHLTLHYQSSLSLLILNQNNGLALKGCMGVSVILLMIVIVFSNFLLKIGAEFLMGWIKSIL